MHFKEPLARRSALAFSAFLALARGLVVAGCGGGSSTASASSEGKISAVGAENEYADVIEQIGGKYVDVSAVESDPNTDPHTFEASASVAQQVSGADVLVENGVGYDSYMEKIESASSSSSRKVINVQELLGLPDSTANPHLWYKPETMPAVAKQLVADFSELQPAHKAYFEANLKKFEASLEALAGRPGRLHHQVPRRRRRHHRAGRRLHARSGGDRKPDPLHHAGRHHE